MMDNDKIREYEIKMATHVDAGFQLGVFAIKQLIGEGGAIPEKTLNEGFDYIIAKEKKTIEEDSDASQGQKEREKNIIEFVYKCMKEKVKSHIESQNRFLK